MKRRQTAVYSPGGCGCGLLLLPVIAVCIGVMFALAGLAAAALVLLIVAIGVTIWLCRDRERRRADGKTNVGWVVFLIIAYPLSVSYLVFFVLLMISTFTGESVTVGVGFDESLEDGTKMEPDGKYPPHPAPLPNIGMRFYSAASRRATSSIKIASPCLAAAMLAAINMPIAVM